MIHTFRRGVHPDGNKLTAAVPIEEFPVPDTLCVPLSQHIGAPAEPVVSVGDRVKEGSLIGRAASFVSANVFSPVSGEVTGFAVLPTAPGGSCNHVLISNDGKYERETLPVLTDPSPEEIVSRVRDAGIVGMGGATFPTHVKLSPKSPVDTLIINAAECEPYITCDHRLMLERAGDVLSGVLLLKKALGAERAFVGIERNKPDAIAHMREKAPEGVEIVPLKVKYPQGAEKQLIYAITRRKVPCGKLPADAGCVVDNVHTAYSVCRAVEHGEPCSSRLMTVSGRAAERPGNYSVRNGIPYSFISETVGLKNECAKIVSGGPMMGFAQPDMRVCTAKGGSSLLFLTEKEISSAEPTQCINCARCAKTCPMSLMPMRIDACVLAGDWEGAKKWGVMNCIECGSCAYGCPAKRPLVQSMRLAKKTIKEKKL